MRDRLSKFLDSDWALYLVRGGVVAVNALSILLLGLIMPPEAFGRFVYLWAIILTVASIASLGGPQFLLREMSARQAGVEQGVSFPFAARLILLYPALVLVLLTVVVWGISRWFDGIATSTQGLHLSDIALVTAGAFLINATAHLAGPLRVAGRSNVAMIVRDAWPQLTLILAALLIMATGELRAETVLVGFVSLSAVSLLAGGLWVHSLVSTRDLFRQQGTSTRYQFSFWWNSVLGSLSAQIDILIAGLFLTPAALGTYQILKRFANLLSLPQIIANWAVIVGVGKSFAKQDMIAIQTHCRRGLRLSLVPAIVLLALSLLVAPLIFRLYAIDPTAETVAAYLILLLASMISILFGVNLAVAAQCHLEQHAAIARALGITISAMLLFAMGASMNVATVAVVATLAVLVAQGHVWFAVKRHLRIDTSVRCLVVPQKAST